MAASSFLTMAVTPDTTEDGGREEDEEEEGVVAPEAADDDDGAASLLGLLWCARSSRSLRAWAASEVAGSAGWWRLRPARWRSISALRACSAQKLWGERGEKGKL